MIRCKLFIEADPIPDLSRCFGSCRSFNPPLNYVYDWPIRNVQKKTSFIMLTSNSYIEVTLN